MKIFEDESSIFSKIQGVSPDPKKVVPDYMPKTPPVGPPRTFDNQTIVALVLCPIIGIISFLAQRRIIEEYEKGDYDTAWLLSARVEMLNKLCFTIFSLVVLVVLGVAIFDSFFQSYQIGIKNEPPASNFLRPGF